MTGQTPDFFTWQEESYVICNETGLFTAQIRPHVKISCNVVSLDLDVERSRPLYMAVHGAEFDSFLKLAAVESNHDAFSTGCRRGYILNYLYDRRLYLRGIETTLKQEICPIINGAHPLFKGLEGRYSWFGRTTYENLRLPIDDSCYVFIGKDRIQGRRSPHPTVLDFATVFCLQFEGGQMIKNSRIVISLQNGTVESKALPGRDMRMINVDTNAPN
jgi:hypothetical protein